MQQMQLLSEYCAANDFLDDALQKLREAEAKILQLKQRTARAAAERNAWACLLEYAEPALWGEIVKWERLQAEGQKDRGPTVEDFFPLSEMPGLKIEERQS